MSALFCNFAAVMKDLRRLLCFLTVILTLCMVKSKTEAEIQTKGFKRTFGFRPAIMKWAKGQKYIQTMQYAFIVFYPLIRLMGQANNMKEIALSMLTLTRDGYHKFGIDPKDITHLAKNF